jgi:lipopolysaccharide transport system permease protein
VVALEPSAAAPGDPRPYPGSSRQPPPSQPEQPLIVIEAGKGGATSVNLGDLWVYRELLYFLIWRDLKVRYKQAVLGIAWVVMQPLLTTLIFTIFLGRLARIPSGAVPYSLFAYSGLLLWTFFASSVTYGSNSLVGSSQLITKVYFPRMLVPCAAIGARVLDLAIAFVILAGLMLYHRIALTWGMLMVPLFVGLLVLLALGLGMWASALNVKYRDIGIALPVVVQLWMFVSPIVYPASLVPARWQLLYSLNPLVGIIEGFRSALFGAEFYWPAIGISAVITLAVLFSSAYIFRRMEKGFADHM